MHLGLLLSGIVLVIIAVVLFIIDWKKNKAKPEDLERINTDMEYLLEEINTMSTIILDEIDKRHSKMLDIYSEFESLMSAGNNEIQQKEIAVESEIEKPADDNKRKVVFNLYNEGLSSYQIARRLNMGTGEVELILRLKNRSI